MGEELHIVTSYQDSGGKDSTKQTQLGEKLGRYTIRESKQGKVPEMLIVTTLAVKHRKNGTRKTNSQEWMQEHFDIQDVLATRGRKGEV